MNDVLNGMTPLTYTKKLRRRNVRINAWKHAVMFTNKMFYNFFLFSMLIKCKMMTVLYIITNVNTWYDLALPSLVRKQAQTFANKQAQSKPNTQFSRQLRFKDLGLVLVHKTSTGTITSDSWNGFPFNLWSQSPASVVYTVPTTE